MGGVEDAINTASINGELIASDAVFVEMQLYFLDKSADSFVFVSKINFKFANL